MIDDVPSAYQVLPEVIVGKNEGQRIISKQSTGMGGGTYGSISDKTGRKGIIYGDGSV